MRPVRTIAAVMFAAAVAVTGCAAHSTATDPSAVPAAPVAASPASPAPKLATPAPKQTPISKPAVAHKAPVLADGRYDAYIRQVNSRGDYVVVDLVQAFHDKAAVEAAIADGQPRDTAQYLYTYVRNENPRLRTVRLADGLRLDLLGDDCEAPISTKLNTLAAHVNAGVGQFYYELTVTGGAVQRIEELRTANAC
jgi:hypothetical protein